MKTEESTVPRRGTPTERESSEAGKNGGARKLAANELDALWDEVIAHRMATFRWVRQEGST
ncbi:hypothetical protein [Paraburkholderia sp. HD33-4]|uniref:hypothetical protein n=1 Tax=Paraburkholderia sp. HD33-4 TaxID=2883242 RepID=UPI001F477706|nr:hypothetical protein [Paraburkholderia sp. HD33-4]